MANTIDSMLIALGLDSTGLTRGLAKSTRDIGAFERSATRALAKAGSAVPSAVPALSTVKLQASLKTASAQVTRFATTTAEQMQDLRLLDAARAARQGRTAGQALTQNLTAEVRRLEARGMVTPEFANQLAGQMAAAGRRANRALRDALESRIGDLGRGLQSVGTTLTVGLTAPLVGFGALSLKTAVSFEDAMTQVAKTAGGTAQEIDALGQEFRKLSQEAGRPGANQIAGIAALGAQLGVARPELLGFTDVVTKAAAAMESMSAEDIATSFAQFKNVLGLSVADAERFGSALATLADSGAATERQIVEMGLRIAGAGKTVGLSSSDVLSFATAISSAGVEAEAGGTAISRTMIEIKKAVDAGGAKLDAFAQVANTSSAAFRDAFRKNAAGAIADFIEGLGTVEARGGSLFATLDKLGLDAARNTDVLTRLANAGRLFRDSLATGGAAFAAGSRLQEEFARKAGTTSAQLEALKNQALDVAREFGGPLIAALRTTLGVVTPLIQRLADMAKEFTRLPAGTQRTIITLAALAAAIGPVVAAIGRLLQTQALLRVAQAALTLSLSQAGAAAASAGAAAATGAAGFGVLGTTLVAGGAVIAGLALLVLWLNRTAKAHAEAKKAADDFRSSLSDLSLPQLSALGSQIQTEITTLEAQQRRLRQLQSVAAADAAGAGRTPAASLTTAGATQDAAATAQRLTELYGQRLEVAKQLNQATETQRAADARHIQDLATLISQGNQSTERINEAKAALAGYNALLKQGIKDAALELDIRTRVKVLEDALTKRKTVSLATGELTDDQLKALKASVDVARNKLETLRERALALKDPLARLQVVLDTAPALRAAGELRDKLQRALAQQPTNSPAAAAVSGFVGDLAGAVRQAVDAGTQAIVESAQDAGSRLEVIRETQDGTTGAALRFVAAYGQAQRALEAVNGLITAQGGPLTADNSLLTTQLNLLRQIQAVREQTAEDRLRLVGGNEIAEFLKAAQQLQAAQDALTVAVAARDQSAAHQAEADLERLRKRITALRAAIVVALQARGLTA
ncbi:MAG TPA: phage tail tape measure protein, partial [Gemmatimonadales bacterium]|nr:phage tail tape measure protein [Gemmatimonadales bacterium]